PENSRRFVDAAGRFLQRGFALHHAGAGAITELLDERRWDDCHGRSSRRQKAKVRRQERADAGHLRFKEDDRRSPFLPWAFCLLISALINLGLVWAGFQAEF